MSRYYALVLVAEDVPEADACDAAFDLLAHYMYSGERPPEESRFDYLLDPEDIAALSESESPRNVWRADEIVENIAELGLEAIITPDGRWHEPEAGQLWDDEAWVLRAREILRRHHGCLALRHVLHI